MTQEPRKPDLLVYTVTKGKDKDAKKGELKSYFHQIGAAWSNSKNGFNLQLFALPVNGEMVLLPPLPKEDAPPGPEA